MAWFADLSPCDYFGSEFSSCLRAVGWLERGRAFPTGAVDTRVYRKLVELARDPWEPLASAGIYGCELCLYESEVRGSKCLLIAGDGFAYVCPEMIVHSMNAHGYCPPAEFTACVLACPTMRSMDYLKAMMQCARPLVRLGR